MSARRGLGRGLSSLISDTALGSDDGSFARSAAYRMVPIEEIQVNPEQPRQVFTDEALEGLAESIRRHGVLSPLLVRKEDGLYVLIAGERRWRAAALAGVQTVPVIVRRADDAADQLELALVENLQREDLDPIEAALGYQRLIEAYDYTQADVASRVGKQRATVANALRLLKLPDSVLNAVRGGLLSAGHARTLVPLIDTDHLDAALKKVLDEGLSVRATEVLVNRLLKPEPPPPKRGEPRADQAVGFATDLLTKALQTSVDIRPRRNGSGRIVIDYADREQLERLIAIMRSGA